MQAAYAACFFAKIDLIFFFCDISAYYRQQKKQKRKERKPMVNIYQKPDYYDELRNQDNPDIANDRDRILTVCAYMAQKYVNGHYGLNTRLSEQDLQDMVQDMVVYMWHEVDAYQNKEDKVIFWKHINKHIKWAAHEAYMQQTASLGESAETARRAKEVKDIVEQKNMSLEDVAKEKGYKVATVVKYLNISGGRRSLDAEDDDGHSLLDQIGDNKESGKEKKEAAKEILATLYKQFNEEEQFIMEVYLKVMRSGEKAWKRAVYKICRQRGITDAKVNRVTAVIRSSTIA